MGNYQVHLDTRLKQGLEAMNAYIVISKDDCVQLIFL